MGLPGIVNGSEGPCRGRVPVPFVRSDGATVPGCLGCRLVLRVELVRVAVVAARLLSSVCSRLLSSLVVIVRRYRSSLVVRRCQPRADCNSTTVRSPTSFLTFTFPTLLPPVLALRASLLRLVHAPRKRRTRAAPCQRSAATTSPSRHPLRGRARSSVGRDSINGRRAAIRAIATQRGCYVESAEA